MLCFSMHLILSAQPEKNKSTSKSNRTGLQTHKLTTFYSEEFANSIPAGWHLTDSAGNGEVWKHTTSGPVNYANDALQSNSAQNGWVLIDDDSYGNNGSMMAELISPAIDCSAKAAILLSFEEQYRHYTLAGSEAIVYISNDSINWVSFHHAETGLANNAATSNPNSVSINISSVAANQSTVYLKFLYRGDYGYFWQIDDIKLTEVPSIDAEIVGVDYPSNACEMSNATNMAVRLLNKGFAPVFDFKISYQINNGNIITENVNDTIAPGTQQLIIFNQPADLSLTNLTQATIFIEVAGDGNQLNDTIQFEYNNPDVSAFALNIGFESIDIFNDWKAEDTDQDFTIWAPLNNANSNIDANTGLWCMRRPATGLPNEDWLFSGCVYLKSGSFYSLSYFNYQFDTNAASIQIFLMDTAYSGTVNKQVIFTQPAGAGNWINYLAPFTVNTDGFYYLGFQCLGALPNGSSSSRLDDVTLSAISGNPEIAYTFLNVYPNPVEDFLFIKTQSITATSVLITNIAGQTVLHTTYIGNQFPIDVTSLPQGMYMVTVTNETSTSSQKIVKQ